MSEELNTEANKLKNGKPSGGDEIPPKLLKLQPI